MCEKLGIEDRDNNAFDALQAIAEAVFTPLAPE